MSESKHTPGPMEWPENPNYDEIASMIDSLAVRPEGSLSISEQAFLEAATEWIQGQDATAGPWSYRWGTSEYNSTIKTATIWGENVGDRVATVHARQDATHIASARARLIAAAPDLLAACEAALEVFGDEPCWYDHHGLCQAHHMRRGSDGEPECEVDLLRAAITKARQG